MWEISLLFNNQHVWEFQKFWIFIFNDFLKFKLFKNKISSKFSTFLIIFNVSLVSENFKLHFESIKNLREIHFNPFPSFFYTGILHAFFQSRIDIKKREEIFNPFHSQFFLINVVFADDKKIYWKRQKKGWICCRQVKKGLKDSVKCSHWLIQ